MREYKGLVIPPRLKRNTKEIEDKQGIYCKKTNCRNEDVDCPDCLFTIENITLFKEWYLSKNKRSK